ncbi:DUF881 domain-containing protein [Calidifontibacter terrae]
MKRRTPWTAMVTVVAVSAGLMFGVSARAAKGTDLRPGQRDLVQVVQEADRRVKERATTVRSLQTEVDTLSKGKAAPGAASVGAAADAQAPAAGFTAVKGSVVTVSLDDSHRDPSTLPAGGNLNWMVVHQQDVQSVVNALWRGGATSMMLMDQRVISTSAVRCVGNTLILQGRVYSPPFTISAMGDPTALKAALQDDPDVSNYRDYVDLVGIGYDVKTKSEVTFPAYEGSPKLQYAKPIPAPGSAGSASASSSSTTTP